MNTCLGKEGVTAPMMAIAVTTLHMLKGKGKTFPPGFLDEIQQRIDTGEVPADPEDRVPWLADLFQVNEIQVNEITEELKT